MHTSSPPAGRAPVIAVLLVAVVVATALWLSTAVIGHIEDDDHLLTRVAFFPRAWTLAALLAAVATCLMVLRPPSSVLWPLLATGVLLLPWLPGDVPLAMMLWTGRLATLFWLAVAVAVAATAPLRALVPEDIRTAFGDGWKAPLLAGGLAAMLFGAAAVHVSPQLPAGDEPHYLVITQTILNHGHLRVEATYRDEAYTAYHPDTLRPHYLRRGQDGEIYSIHAAGLAVLVLPAFVAGGYPAVVAFLIVLAAIGTALAWRAAFVVTGHAGAAWFGWATLTLSVPYFFHAMTVYPDLPAAVIVLGAVCFLMAAPPETPSRWAIHGALLAVLPWLHTRYAVLAVSLAILTGMRLLRTRGPWWNLGAFVLVPMLSAAAWLTYFQIIYGVPDPRVAYGWQTDTRLGYVPAGLTGLLFDQQFGVVANAPVYAVAVLGLLILARRGRGLTSDGRLTGAALAGTLVFVALPYLVAVASYAMWWGGHSAPGRFAVPVLPLLAIPAAAFWAWPPGRAARPIAVGLLVGGAFVTATIAGTDQGRLLYDMRGSAAQWVEWIEPTVDVARALPSIFRDDVPGALMRAAIWMGWGALAWLVVTLAARRTADAGAVGATTTVVLALAVSGAIATAWQLTDGSPVRHEDAKFLLLDRFDTDTRPWGVHYGQRSAGSADAHLPLLSLHRSPDRHADEGPLAWFSLVPAGRYTLIADASSAWARPLAVSVGRGPDGVFTHVPAGAAPGRTEYPLDLPVDVHSIVVYGDRDARHAVTQITLRPESRRSPGARAARGRALRARAYGNTTAYFLDDRSHVEAEGVWVEGATSAEVVLAPGSGREVVRLRLRNGAPANRLRITQRHRTDVLELSAGGVHLLDLDVVDGGAWVRLEPESGFRPSHVEPGSTDDRFLGIRLELVDDLSPAATHPDRERVPFGGVLLLEEKAPSVVCERIPA